MVIGPKRHIFHGSTAIRSCSYDESRQELSVDFHSGQSYDFSGVPPDVFEAFTQAPSAGQFYHRSIKGTYG